MIILQLKSKAAMDNTGSFAKKRSEGALLCRRGKPLNRSELFGFIPYTRRSPNWMHDGTETDGQGTVEQRSTKLSDKRFECGRLMVYPAANPIENRQCGVDRFMAAWLCSCNH